MTIAVEEEPTSEPFITSSEVEIESSTEQIETETEETKEETTESEIPTEPIISSMWTTTHVYFRKGPHTDFEPYMILPKGTEILTINFNWDNEWTQVSCNNEIGYIYTEYLAETYVNKYDYYYVQYGNQIEELDLTLQEYAQNLLNEWGLIDFYKLFLCQAYQESRYNMSSIGRAHGGYHDWGIMQIWEGHEHNTHSIMYQVIKSHPNYKTDPYDNIYCGLWMWKYWYEQTGDYITALGCYLTGTTQPSQYYIECVLGHLNNLYREE